MKTRAAVLFDQPGKWEVIEADLDEPRQGEVLLKIAASGLCHSDDHFATGDIPAPGFPYCGGHEVAGVVESLGEGVRDLQVGDHVVTSFIPACGHCRWCASGKQNLCDNGALIASGEMLDGKHRMHYQGKDVLRSALIGGFAEYGVLPEWSCIKIPQDMSLLTASLLGCGVPTGWGSAVNAAQVEPGDVVIVAGIGGIGINAVQGAAHAGATRIIAVDPVQLKRDAALRLGATDAVESIEEAGELARSVTNGQGADAAILTIGVMRGQRVAEAVDAIGKGGTVVITGVAPAAELGIPDISLISFAMYQKRIQGVLYGMMSPSKDVPRLLRMYEQGQLKLDELMTRTYSLEEINVGYADMHAGTNIRGAIKFF